MNLETIKTELKEYIADRLQDYDTETINKLTEDNELHHELFNTDYYIIGYYKAEQWLKNHSISMLSALNFVKDYEIENFYGYKREYTYGEFCRDLDKSEADIWKRYSKSNSLDDFGKIEDINQEKIVNMLAYIVGEELINELEPITQ